MTTPTEKEKVNKKEKIVEKAVAKALQNIKFTEYDAAEKIQKVNEFYSMTGECILQRGPTDLDIPPCDHCGKDDSAHLKCNACHSAYYCSKECQRLNWKLKDGGHKKACKSMKEDSEQAARIVVNMMQSLEVNNECFDLLDSHVSYKNAEEQGINNAIRTFFLNDIDHVMDQYRSGSPLSYTTWVMSKLWRGQRRDGRGVKSNVFNCVDGQRIKHYVHSHPDALDAWLNASLAVFHVFMDDRVYSNKVIHPMAHRSARDTMAGWILVCTNKKAAKAIVLGPSRRVDDAAVTRAKSMAKRIQKTMRFRSRVGNAERDHNGTCEGMLNQTAAMLSYWIKEFGVPIDFDAELGLKGAAKQMYLQLATPLAIGTIEKQRTLTMTEVKEYVDAYSTVDRRRGRGRGR